MRKSDSIKTLAAAMSKAQAEIKTAEMDGFNPHFKSKFATLKSVVEATRPALTKHGLSVFHFPCTGADGKPCLETVITHDSGEWMSEVCPLILSKQDMQGMVAALTYMKRAALSAVTGAVADEDDDGNNSSEKPAQKVPKVLSSKSTPVEIVDPSEQTIGIGKKPDRKFKDVEDIELEQIQNWIDSNNVSTAKSKRFTDLYKRYIGLQIDRETRMPS